MGFGSGDVNWYAYVGNAPNMATDPSGNISGCGAIDNSGWCEIVLPGGLVITVPCPDGVGVGKQESTSESRGSPPKGRQKRERGSYEPIGECLKKKCIPVCTVCLVSLGDEASDLAEGMSDVVMGQSPAQFFVQLVHRLRNTVTGGDSDTTGSCKACVICIWDCLKP
jgi:hypothetical protein